MIHLLLCCGFLLLGAVAAWAATLGRRGQACDRALGYEVPEPVRSDPELRERANELVAFWCTGAAILSVAPLVPVAGALLGEDPPPLSNWQLLLFALYSLVVVIVGTYPFEKIKQLGSSTRP